MSQSLEELKEKLKEIVLSVSPENNRLTTKDIGDDVPIINPRGPLGLDSLDALDITLKIEETFKVKFTGIAVARDALKDINALTNFVGAALNLPTNKEILTQHVAATNNLNQVIKKHGAQEVFERPVMITGMGIVSPLGLGIGVNVAKLDQGQSVLRRFDFVAARENTSFVAGVIGDQVDKDPASFFETLYAPVREAIAMANLSPKKLQSCGIFLGTTLGSLAVEEPEYKRNLNNLGACKFELSKRNLGALSEHVAKEFSINGPCATYTTACTSSVIAVVQAIRAINNGYCERAIVVGIDMLSNLSVYGFNSLLLYDQEALRPFDLRRSGLQLGEASAALIIEPASSDSRAPQIVGAHTQSGVSQQTASSTDAATISETIGRAIAKAQIDKSEINIIKAHATGTRDNDLAEAVGMRACFSQHVPPVFTLKGYFGHSLGAAGALELALSLGCFAQGFIPKSVGFDQVDPEIGIEPLRSQQPFEAGYSLHNCFGFGGSSVSLVVKHV